MVDQKIIYGVIGLVALLVGFGGTQLLTQDQLDKTYVCTTNEKFGLFERLSSTSKTGYYTDEAGVLRSSACTNGFWIPLKEYAQTRGIDPSVLLQKQLEQPVVEQVRQGVSGGKQYLCNSKECVPK